LRRWRSGETEWIAIRLLRNIDDRANLLPSPITHLHALLFEMGIFAVVTFSVNQRKSEIGIRMALGARVSDIKGLVVRQ